MVQMRNCSCCRKGRWRYGRFGFIESAMIDLRSGKGIEIRSIVKKGATRDFRDLALIKLSAIHGDSMSTKEFEDFLSPVLTEKSPFYYTGMLLVAQKYISADDKNNANKWLDKIMNNKKTPAVIAAIAESLK